MLSHVPAAVRPRRGAMLFVLLAGQIMASIDGSIVSVAAPAIRTGLRAGGAEIQLIVSSYLLTTGVLFVTCARLGDVLGHRRAFLLGTGWFTAASLLCGSALTPAMLIVTRVLQAMGAALLMPQVFSLIHRHWEGAERRRAIGVYSTVLALGVVLGQVGGGLIAGGDLFGLSWRPVFLINVPVGVLVLVLGPRVIGATRTDGRARLDLVGVALLTVAMTALTVPLILGRDRGWPAWTWIMLACGVALLWIFGRYERSARDPILDVAALKPKELRLGMTACCVVMGCYAAFLLTLTLHLQSDLGYTPLQAGLTFVPYALGFGVLSLTWNIYPNWLQHSLPVAGPIAFAAGSAISVVLYRHHWHPIESTPLLFFAGIGHAAGYSPLIAHITSRVEPRLASAVSALNSTGPTLSELVAVAGLGTLYFAAADSAGGLLDVAAAITVLLAIATACAALAMVAYRSANGSAARGIRTRRSYPRPERRTGPRQPHR